MIVQITKKWTVFLLVLTLSGCLGIGNEGRKKEVTPTKISESTPPPYSAVSPAVSSEKTTLDKYQTKTSDFQFSRQGTGKFISQSNEIIPSISSSAGNYSMNFQEVEIREFIGAIFGSTLKKNYTIDPAVTGKVTVRTGSPIPYSQIIPYTENVLSLHNISIVEQNGLFKFVPKSKAISSPDFASRSYPSSSIGSKLEIIPVRFVAAEEIVKIIKPIIGEGVQISSDNSRNVVTVIGQKAERDNVLELIRIFDADLLAGMSFELIELNSSDPNTIETELKNILATDEGIPLLAGTRFIPIERLNSLLIIANTTQKLKQGVAWVRRLDVGKDYEKKQLFVYRVQNIEAADLASALTELLDEDQPTRSQAENNLVAPTLTQTTLKQKSSTTNSGAQSRKQEIVNADNQKSGATYKQQSTLKIVANENTNSLFIKATPKEYESILSIIKLIDIVPLQVMIEATIAEVTLNDELKFGIEWFFEKGDSKATFSTASNGSVLSSFPGFSYLYGAANVSAVINALDSVTDVNILSSPQLMVLDNHKAHLQIGDQVPIATQSVVSNTDPDAPTVNTIEFRDTGIVLKVTPRVNSGGLVNLNIEQEVSDVVKTTTSGIDSPTIRQRKITSSIVIQNGETVALGGLIREKKTDQKTGVPVLSSVPVLGYLFGTKSDVVSRTELLILITPKVVKNLNEAADLTAELKRKIQAFKPSNDD